ncbi:MAG: phytanoyl-CoA dioxygenase family protein [Verrucomicrobia bacterium]|nr:phytanoyl-CoA dioxygenase family protein [Verrucomicrobiota bacterium]
MTDDIGAFFAENGYYHARGVFTPEEMQTLEADFDRIVGQLQQSGEAINATWGGEVIQDIKGASDVLLHTHNVQQYSAAWMNACLNTRLLDIIEAMIGPDIILHHSKLFMKPPAHGSPFPMHQDWSYFPTVRDTMMAGIVHVSEATDAMGCLRVYPGSHKLGRVTGSAGRERIPLLEQYPIDKATIVEAQPGDVVFFHYFTLHGSMPNRSNKSRKTVLIQVHAGHDELEPEALRHPYERLVLRGWNSQAKRSLANSGKG